MVNVSPPGGSGSGGGDSTDDTSDDDFSGSTGSTGSTTTSSGSPDVGDVAREARRRAPEPSGIDAGEPISGVDGQGSPRDDSDSTPVEGGDGTDGMGGGGPDVGDVASEAEERAPEPADSGGLDAGGPGGGPSVEDVAREAEQRAPEPAGNLGERRAEATAERLGREQELEAVRSEPDTRDLTAPPGDSQVGQVAGQAREQQLEGPVEAAAEEQQELRGLVAASSGAVAREDIGLVSRTGDGVQASLTREAELEQARENFDLDRDPDRVFSGTEQVPLFFDEDDFRVARNDEGDITARVTDEAQGEFREFQAQKAAPFVDPGDEGRIADFLTEAQETQIERADRELPNTVAVANVPFTDKNLVETLEAGGRTYRENVVNPLSEGAGDLYASPAGVALTGPLPEDTRRNFGEGAVGGIASLTNVPAGAAGVLRLGQRTTEIVRDPETEAPIAAGGAALTLASGGETAVERPAFTVGAAGGAAVGSVAGGAALGRAGRFTRSRARTAGARTFDLDDGSLVNKKTAKVFDPDQQGDPSARFPGAQDPDTFRSNPPQAVRQQADDFTPDAVEQQFQAVGATEGATLKKALDAEPDGPGVGNRGFRTQEGSFESPGGFVGPELSPQFLRATTERSFSLRPGLPDLGGKPTGALVRTRVGRPDADNLDDFNRELLDRAGETTARTKPASEVNVGEIEAVIPPEAEFVDAGSGFLRGAARRAGIGSDFAVRIGGRRVPFTDRKVGGQKVPLRPVADPDLVDSGGLGLESFLGDTRGQVGAGAAGSRASSPLSDIVRAPRRSVDRPVPFFGGVSSGATSNESIDATPTVDGPETPERVRRSSETAAPSSTPSSPIRTTESTGGGSETSRTSSTGSSTVTGGSFASSGTGSTGSSGSVTSQGSLPSSAGAPSSAPAPVQPAPSTPAFGEFGGAGGAGSSGGGSARLFDLEQDSSKKRDDFLAVSSGEQFIVPFSGAEDVVGTGGGFALGI